MLEFPFDGFSIEASRSLIALLDVDQNGKLGFPAFKKLWCELRIFKAVFVALDDTKRGLLNSQQLVCASVFNNYILFRTSEFFLLLFARSAKLSECWVSR